jgi:hypothetical protein
MFQSSLFEDLISNFDAGKKAIDALLKEKFRNSVKRPEITDRDEASKVVQQLMEQHNFFFRVEKEEHRQLDVDSKQVCHLSY